MKIAFFVPAWPPKLAANGIVTYVSNVAPALRQLGHEVFLLVAHGAADETDPHVIDLQRFSRARTWWDRVKQRVAPESAAVDIAASNIVSALRHVIEKHGLDIFEMEETFGTSVVVSRLRRLPVVVRLHGPWIVNRDFGNPAAGGALGRGRAEREGRAIGDAQFVTAPSAAVLQSVRDCYGLDLIASRVIPNPLEAAPESEAWDVKSCDVNRLLFVGRFDILKGGDTVVRAFADLAASFPRLTLTFVGPDNGIETADHGIQSFEQFLRSNVPEQIRSRVEFLGRLSHADVMRLRPRHFATIVASRHEMMPYAVLEAMALGCPLVATSVGGIPELIRDRHNGLLVPSDDAKAMADACRTLLDDHALAARLGRQAWRDCSTLYAPEVVAAQTVAVYQAAIDAFKRQSQ